MKKTKRFTKKSDQTPEAMPEAAYNISPDDIEIGDELTLKNLKKKDFVEKEDH